MRSTVKTDSDFIVKTEELRTPDPGTFFRSPLDQGTKPLWYKLKADRNPGGLMSTGDDSSDFSRVQSQVNQTQTTTGSRQEFYSFSVDAKSSVGKNTVMLVKTEKITSQHRLRVLKNLIKMV